MTNDTALPPTIVDTTVDHTADEVAIRELIADVERAFNWKDPELLADPFAANGTSVGVTGAEVRGRDAIEDAGRKGFAGPLRDQYARYEIHDLVFIRPDVALVHKHARATDAAGELIDIDHAMVALYVVVKEGDRWWVAARQNTLVAR